MRARLRGAGWWLALVIGSLGCGAGEPDFERFQRGAAGPVLPDRNYFRDAHGRYVTFNGINVGGHCKLPASTDPVSYVGRPFPLQCAPGAEACGDAEHHLAQIERWGFNAVRLLFTWEAVEPEAKGEYDYAFLDALEQTIAIARRHGLYVLLDMHQDLFSRHLYASYNREPGFDLSDPTLGNLAVVFPNPDALGDPELPWFSHRVQGDGAPRWVVEACLPEKAAHIGGPTWGVFRPLGLLSLDEISGMFGAAPPRPGAPPPQPAPDDPMAAALEAYLVASAAGILPATPAEGTDFLPMTYWWLNTVLSLDVDRCYGSLFAGEHLFPDMRFEHRGEQMSVQEALQRSYAGVWREVARRAARYDNVIGYDLMNEPSVGYVMLNAVAVYARKGSKVELDQMLRPLLGLYTDQVMEILFSLKALPEIPPRPQRGQGFDADGQPIPWDETAEAHAERVARWEQTRAEKLRAYGLDGLALDAAVGLIDNFDYQYLLPLYERVADAIAAVDPQPVFWLQTAGPSDLLGSLGEGLISEPVSPPDNMQRVVFAPHWYPPPEIQPNLGFGMPPRDYAPGELEFYDYAAALAELVAASRPAMQNAPLAIGEFGTFFNYRGIEQARAEGYPVASELLDNHYQAYEQLGLSRFVWHYNPDNTFAEGDAWNSEDFSLVDQTGAARGARAWMRPYARCTSGKPIASHFYSDYHYFDPQQHRVDPRREFELVFATRETTAPTEIFVPELQYPDGFHVWLSDGYAAYDAEAQILYVQPTRDAPGSEHRVIIRPPLAGLDARGWDYFFKGDRVVAGGR
jgi:hypothetical protein